MSAPASRGSHLMRRLWTTTRHDIGRKLTALVMATSLWLLLQNLVIARQPLELPVRPVATQADADTQRATTPGIYLIVPDELIVRSVSDPRVHLTVSGLRDEVTGLSMSARLPFTVADLGGADEITLTRPLERDAFDSPGQKEPHLTSFRVRPDVLTVTLARRDTQEVPLTADNVVTAGRPKDKYLFRSSKISLQPSVVRITGPAKVIGPLAADPAKIKLAPVDIADRSTTVSQEVGLSPELDALGVSLAGGTESVLVTVIIEADDVTKDLFSVPIVYRNEDVLELRKLRATKPSTVDIRVVGPPSEILGLTDEDLLASIVLVFDWRAQPDSFTGQVGEATGKLGVGTIGLPDTVRVTDPKGGEIRIEYSLEPLNPLGAADNR